MGKFYNGRIAGDEGHDYLCGGGDNDKIYGGLQPDFIRGNAGHDKLYANGGNDRLYCDYSAGSSTLHGGAGGDFLVAANTLADQLNGDGGRDTASADQLDKLISVEEIAS